MVSQAHGVDGVHEGLAADVLHARAAPRGAVHRPPPLPPPVVHRAQHPLRPERLRVVGNRFRSRFPVDLVMQSGRPSVKSLSILP
jgi:hypothetical protein